MNERVRHQMNLELDKHQNTRMHRRHKLKDNKHFIEFTTQSNQWTKLDITMLFFCEKQLRKSVVVDHLDLW